MQRPAVKPSCSLDATAAARAAAVSLSRSLILARARPRLHAWLLLLAWWNCRRPTAEFRTDDAGDWQRVTGVLLSGNVIASYVIQRAKDSGAYGEQLGALSLEDIADVHQPVRHLLVELRGGAPQASMHATCDRPAVSALQGFNASLLPTSVYENAVTVSWPDLIRSVTGRGFGFTGEWHHRPAFHVPPQRGEATTSAARHARRPTITLLARLASRLQLRPLLAQAAPCNRWPSTRALPTICELTAPLSPSHSCWVLVAARWPWCVTPRM